MTNDECSLSSKRGADVQWLVLRRIFSNAHPQPGGVILNKLLKAGVQVKRYPKPISSLQRGKTVNQAAQPTRGVDRIGVVELVGR